MYYVRVVCTDDKNDDVELMETLILIEMKKKKMNRVKNFRKNV